MVYNILLSSLILHGFSILFYCLMIGKHMLGGVLQWFSAMILEDCVQMYS